MGLLSWIIVGAVAGMIGKAIMPGSREEPGGWGGTILLGVVGALVGGFVSSLFFGKATVSGVNFGTVAVATLGSCIAIGVLRLLKK